MITAIPDMLKDGALLVEKKTGEYKQKMRDLSAK
jgi:hypothetical protein